MDGNKKVKEEKRGRVIEEERYKSYGFHFFGIILV